MTRQTREERLRRRKAWQARAYANGGSTKVPADELADLIRAMLANGGSLATVAAHIGGVSPSYVGRLARGELQSVGLDRAALIRAAAARTPRRSGPVRRGQWVSGVGAGRRIRALVALGYSTFRLADETGLSRLTMHELIEDTRPWILQTTHDAVAATFDRLCMTAPQASDQYEQSGITRARDRARLAGWAPPLAWDDIDDPDEQPQGVADERRDDTAAAVARAEALEQAIELGHTVDRAAADLGISRKTLHTWCTRRGRLDLYNALAERTRTPEAVIPERRSRGRAA